MSLRVSLPFCFALGGAVGAPGLVAQQPVTRAQAVEAALARGARAALGRADTAFAAGALRTARALPNPTLSGTYTRDVPHYHYVADLALDLPWLRSARVGAAASARDAARYGFAFERAAIRFDADTTYTRALAALAHARLSRRTARDADSLLTMARLRRERAGRAARRGERGTARERRGRRLARRPGRTARGAICHGTARRRTDHYPLRLSRPHGHDPRRHDRRRGPTAGRGRRRDPALGGAHTDLRPSQRLRRADHPSGVRAGRSDRAGRHRAADVRSLVAVPALQLEPGRDRAGPSGARPGAGAARSDAPRIRRRPEPRSSSPGGGARARRARPSPARERGPRGSDVAAGVRRRRRSARQRARGTAQCARGVGPLHRRCRAPERRGRRRPAAHRLPRPAVRRLALLIVLAAARRAWCKRAFCRRRTPTRPPPISPRRRWRP